MMKNFFALILLIVLFKSSFCFSQDFWEEVILPDSIYPAHVSFNNDSEIYLSSSDGLYKSNDGGSSWNLLLSYPAGLSTINKGEDEILVGIDPQGNLFHSLDDGLAWDTIITGIQGIWLKLIQDSLFFSLDWGSIYKSNDDGINWIKVVSTVNSEVFRDIIAKNDTIFTGSVSFLDPTGGGIYQSHDQGASFTQISLPGYGVSSFALDKDSNLLCGVNFQYNYLAYGVFRSTDNGFTWNNILPGHIVTSLAMDINGGIYAGCDSNFGPEGIQFSSDNGLTWSSLNNGLHDNASITSLVISPDGFIYTVTEDPSILYRSVNPIVQIKEERPIEKAIIVYPNPAHAFLNIKLNEKIHSIVDWHVRIVDALGITVYDEKGHSDIAGKVICSIQDLNSGFYTVIVAKDKEIYSTSFVKY